MNILQTNVLSMIMAVSYHILFLKPMSQVSVWKYQIIDIINILNSNKAHGHDGLSVSMLKLCAVDVATPLQIIFGDCINCGIISGYLEICQCPTHSQKRQPSDKKQL